jgi:septal ring factor EnvC (AmiA/AmiB activator)
VSELDSVYERAKHAWATNAAKFEREQPLLARAFAEAQPNRELAAEFERQKRQVDNERNEFAHEITAVTHERDAALRDIASLRAQRDAERRAHTTAQRYLEGQLTDLQRETARPLVPIFDGDEQQQLAALGWRKDA